MSASRTDKAVTNIFFNFINQIVSLVLLFGERTVFIHYFNAEYLGLDGLFTDVLGLLSMADLGFNTAMVYSFYKPLADKDYKKIAALTTFYRKVYWVIAGTVSVVGLLLIPALPYLVNVEQEIPQLTVYYLFALAKVVVSYLFIYKTSIVTADQRNYLLVKITMIVCVLTVTTQILVIVLFHDYIAYLAMGLLFAVINNVLSSRLASREYPFIEQKVELKREEKRGIFKNIGSVFLYKVSSSLLNATDNIFISTLVGTAAVGYYSNYLMLQTKIAAAYSLIFTSLTASIGNLIVKEKADKRFEIFQAAQSISFVICSILVPCFIALVNDLFMVWLGQEYVLSGEVVCAIGMNMYLGCVLQPLWSYREATGLYQKTKWVMVWCAVLNLILSYIFGKKAGIAGILLASSIARICTYILYEPKILFREYFEKNTIRYYGQLILNSLIIVTISIVLLWLNRYFVPKSIWTWIFKSGVYVLICAVIGGILYYRSNGIQILKKRMNIFIKNKRGH